MNHHVFKLEISSLLLGFSLCPVDVCLSVSKQGLLRVAIENARVQEKQDQLERTELTMELVRERELRETLERQLSVEQKNRGIASATDVAPQMFRQQLLTGPKQDRKITKKRSSEAPPTA